MDDITLLQNPPAPPAEFPELGFRADRWRRMFAGLYLMAKTGWGTVRELAQELEAYYDLAADSRAPRQLFDEYLREPELIVYDVLPMFRAGLAVARLTEKGKAVCRCYGWEPEESEWERLIRLHEGDNQPEHTAQILAFAHQARIRGFKATVVPEFRKKVITTARPDVYVVAEKPRRRAYVEVERGHDKEGKWRALMDLQPFVAVVTLTVEKRFSLVKEIKALGLPGGAADLDTLIYRSKNWSRPGLLLFDRWKADGTDILID